MRTCAREEFSAILKLEGEQAVHFCTKVMQGDDSLCLLVSACGEIIFLFSPLQCCLVAKLYCVDLF